MPPAPDGDFASARVQQVVQRRTNQVNACHCDVTAQAPLDTRVQVTLLLNPQGKALQTVTSVDTLAPAYAQCLRFAYQGLEFGKPVHGSGSHLDICIEVH